MWCTRYCLWLRSYPACGRRESKRGTKFHSPSAFGQESVVERGGGFESKDAFSTEKGEVGAGTGWGGSVNPAPKGGSTYYE